MTEHTKAARPHRAAKIMRRLGWHTSRHDNRITGRSYHLALCRYRWWDWGHRLMILVGECHGGNYEAPKPPTWWYRLGPPARMRRTNYPTHPLSTFEIIKDDYDRFRERTRGLNEDQMYEWQAICGSQDGDLRLGHQYWGGSFHGLTSWELPLLAKYLRAWRRRDWYGARTWLCKQALHAAVHQHKPFSCQQTPPKASGGYDHWHCTQRRGHTGAHRYNAMTWTDDVPLVISDAERENARSSIANRP